MSHDTTSVRPDPKEIALCDIEMPEIDQGLAHQAWAKMETAKLDEDGIGHIHSDGLHISFGKNGCDTVIDRHYDICISPGTSARLDADSHCIILIRYPEGQYGAISGIRGTPYTTMDVEMVNNDLMSILSGESFRPAPRYIIDDGRKSTRARIAAAMK